MPQLSRQLVVAIFAVCGLVTAFSQEQEWRSPPDAQFYFVPFYPPVRSTAGPREYEATMREWFGVPLAERTYPARDRDPTMSSEILVLEYEGLRFRIWRSKQSDLDYIQQIVLTSPDVRLRFGLSIGSTRSEFAEKLNVQDMPPSGSVFSYYIEYGGTVSISFDENDRATRIVWQESGH